MSPTTQLPDRLLGIWPHPDDEAYLTAGLMARMTDAGRDVSVLTLTHGEKGTGDPAGYDQPHFAARRAGELRAALATVGVDDVRLGPYRDGECEYADLHDEIGIFAEYAAGPASSSPTDQLAELMGEATYRRWWRRESFRRPTGLEAMSSPFLHRDGSRPAPAEVPA